MVFGGGAFGDKRDVWVCNSRENLAEITHTGLTGGREFCKFHSSCKSLYYISFFPWALPILRSSLPGDLGFQEKGRSDPFHEILSFVVYRCCTIIIIITIVDSGCKGQNYDDYN